MNDKSSKGSGNHTNTTVHMHKITDTARQTFWWPNVCGPWNPILIQTMFKAFSVSNEQWGRACRHGHKMRNVERRQLCWGSIGILMLVSLSNRMMLQLHGLLSRAQGKTLPAIMLLFYTCILWQKTLWWWQNLDNIRQSAAPIGNASSSGYITVYYTRHVLSD